MKCATDGCMQYRDLQVLIKGLCKQGSLRDAKRLLGEMTSCGLRPSVITYNLLMDWYCCVGMLEKALYLHDELKSSSLSPTVITCNVLAAGCSRSEDSIVEMEERGICPLKITYTILIDFFARCNNMEKALELLAQMKRICLVADVYTYSVFSLDKKGGAMKDIWGKHHTCGRQCVRWKTNPIM